MGGIKADLPGEQDAKEIKMLMELDQCSKAKPVRKPVVVGIGGTTRPNSTSERALRYALSLAEKAGATTRIFAGQSLLLPLFCPDAGDRSPEADMLIEALRCADAVIFSSPAYHGSVSGLLKNAIDYIEDMRQDDRPYLSDRAVGTIISAYGEQAIGSTMGTMRNITHALRGWPLPMGVGINALRCSFDENCVPSDDHIANHLRIMAEQAVGFSKMVLSR